MKFPGFPHVCIITFFCEKGTGPNQTKMFSQSLGPSEAMSRCARLPHHEPCKVTLFAIPVFVFPSAIQPRTTSISCGFHEVLRSISVAATIEGT